MNLRVRIVHFFCSAAPPSVEAIVPELWQTNTRRKKEEEKGTADIVGVDKNLIRAGKPLPVC